MNKLTYKFQNYQVRTHGIDITVAYCSFV